MQRILATGVESLFDFDYGEGWLTIHWICPIRLDSWLQIDPDGFCHREMPIRSGDGPPQILEVRSDGFRIRFAPELAEKLELDTDVEFVCELSDQTFDDLCKLKVLFEGGEP